LMEERIVELLASIDASLTFILIALGGIWVGVMGCWLRRR
jgi:hypothetical protein